MTVAEIAFNVKDKTGKEEDCTVYLFLTKSGKTMCIGKLGTFQLSTNDSDHATLGDEDFLRNEEPSLPAKNVERPGEDPSCVKLGFLSKEDHSND